MDKLTDYVRANRPGPFKAKPIYSPDGGSLTFIFEDVEYYRESIDDFVTLYRAKDGNRVVGVQITPWRLG